MSLARRLHVDNLTSVSLALDSHSAANETRRNSAELDTLVNELGRFPRVSSDAPPLADHRSRVTFLVTPRAAVPEASQSSWVESHVA